MSRKSSSSGIGAEPSGALDNGLAGLWTERRLVGPLRAAPEEFHSVCAASRSARPQWSLDNQGHVYVGQVYHVPAGGGTART